MVKQNENVNLPDSDEQFVYVVVNYGRVIGVYRSSESAMRVIGDCATHGQLADLSVKKVLD